MCYDVVPVIYHKRSVGHIANLSNNNDVASFHITSKNHIIPGVMICLNFNLP